MKRHLFNLAAGASLLLFILTTVGWVASHQWFLYASRQSYESRQCTEHALILNRGLIRVGLIRQIVIDNAETATRYAILHAAPKDESLPLGMPFFPVSEAPRWLKRLGFGWQWTSWPGQARLGEASLKFPCWAVMVLAAPLPGAWLLLRRRERKALAEGVIPCPGCGYDLRGSPANGACPECGQARSNP